MSTMEPSHRGSIIFRKAPVLMPLPEKRYRFWGLPKGVSRLPRTAAMFSMVRMGRM